MNNHFIIFLVYKMGEENPIAAYEDKLDAEDFVNEYKKIYPNYEVFIEDLSVTKKSTDIKVKAKKALEESIIHWEELVNTTEVSEPKLGRKFCALCNAFNHSNLKYENRCISCPVMEHTGQPFCRSTPYDQAEIAHDDWEAHQTKEKMEIFISKAKEELKFLKSVKGTLNE